MIMFHVNLPGCIIPNLPNTSFLLRKRSRFSVHVQKKRVFQQVFSLLLPWAISIPYPYLHHWNFTMDTSKLPISPFPNPYWGIWVFPKIGVGPQNGWWKQWKSLLIHGWFGGKTHYFRKHPYLSLHFPWATTFFLGGVTITCLLHAATWGL